MIDKCCGSCKFFEVQENTPFGKCVYPRPSLIGKGFPQIYYLAQNACHEAYGWDCEVWQSNENDSAG